MICDRCRCACSTALLFDAPMPVTSAATRAHTHTRRSLESIDQSIRCFAMRHASSSSWHFYFRRINTLRIENKSSHPDHTKFNYIRLSNFEFREREQERQKSDDILIWPLGSNQKCDVSRARASATDQSVEWMCVSRWDSELLISHRHWTWRIFSAMIHPATPIRMVRCIAPLSFYFQIKYVDVYSHNIRDSERSLMHARRENGF